MTEEYSFVQALQSFLFCRAVQLYEYDKDRREQLSSSDGDKGTVYVGQRVSLARPSLK